VLADLGYPGLILFLINLGVALLSCWRVSRMARKNPSLRYLGIYGNALFSCLIVYAVTGSFLSLQYHEMLWHMVGLSTALYLVAVAESRALESSSLRPKAA
jgi:hypothetical protein